MPRATPVDLAYHTVGLGLLVLSMKQKQNRRKSTSRKLYTAARKATRIMQRASAPLLSSKPSNKKRKATTAKKKPSGRRWGWKKGTDKRGIARSARNLPPGSAKVNRPVGGPKR